MCCVAVKRRFDVVDRAVEVREVREWMVGGGEGGGEYSSVGLGEYKRGFEAVFGGEVAVGVGDALDQAVGAESP